MSRSYVIKQADPDVALIDQFRPESSAHRPRTEARLAFDHERLRGRFIVQDQFVLSTHEGPNAEVWLDSCVECFLQPNERGYFNFEFNAGGHARASFIRDSTRAPDGFKDFTLLSADELKSLAVRSSLPSRVDPEIADSLTWSLEFEVPFALLTKYSGTPAPVAGTRWRGNFYKCGDKTSHPHWAAWSRVDALNFHLPRCFGTLIFAD